MSAGTSSSTLPILHDPAGDGAIVLFYDPVSVFKCIYRATICVRYYCYYNNPARNSRSLKLFTILKLERDICD